MSNPEDPQGELAALDWQIRRYTNTAQAHWDMATHFVDSAKEQERLAAHYTNLRNEYLGRMGVENVLPMPQQAGGGAA